MRQISGELLHQEITRLGSVVVQTWVYHASGILLHAPGDVLTAEHAAVFEKAVLDRVFLVEAGEDRHAALAAGGVVTIPLTGVAPGDVLAEELVAPRSRLRWKPGIALEPALIEELTKEGVASVPVCRGAAPAAIKWARTYLELAPAAPPKAVRPDPTAAAATACAWGLLTPRAKVLVIIPDDMARLRVVNALLATGHEVSESKLFSEVLGLLKAQRSDVVLFDVEGALEVCTALRKEKEARRAVVLALCGDPAKLIAVGPKAMELGTNDLLPLPVSPGLLADRVRAWLRMRNKTSSLPLSIAKERRASERRKSTLTIRLSDPGSEVSMAVTSGALLEISDGGLKMEYGLLEAPDPGAYRLNGVHPRHPLYAYTRDNPAGRNLQVSLSGGGAPAFESLARVIHLNLALGAERVGLVLVKKQDVAAARASTMHRKPPA